MSGLQYVGIIICIVILGNALMGSLLILRAWLNERDEKRRDAEEEPDEPEVRKFREQLDTWDSALFLESSDIRSEGQE